MIAPDSSVLVAGFVAGHQFHEVSMSALAEVKECGNLISHTITETFSVLSAPGRIYRAEPGAIVAYLDQFLGEEGPIPVPPAAYREALDILTESGRPGGAVYDALIALAARDAEATLVSLDARATPTYEACSADVRLITEAT